MAIWVSPKLSSLPGVGIASPQDGQVLTYDSGTGEWVNEAPGAPDLSGYLPLAGGALTGAVTQTVADALTNTTNAPITIGHNTSGTAAAGFGTGIYWLLESSTTADQVAGNVAIVWDDATHATRTSEFQLGTVLAGAAVTPLKGTGKKVTFTTTNTQTSGISEGAIFNSYISPTANGTGNYRGATFNLLSQNPNEISSASNFQAYISIDSYAATLSGVEILNAYGTTAYVVNDALLRLRQDSKAAGAIVVNKYGLRVEDMTHGTNNWSIYTGAGKVRLGDVVNFAGTMGDSSKTVGTDAPADWVQVEIGGTVFYLPAYSA